MKSKNIEKEADRLLSGGHFGDRELRKNGIRSKACPIYAQGKVLHSWIVPIIVDDRFAAFFQFLDNGTLSRFSMFYHIPGNYENCPKFKLWFDSNRILQIANSIRKENEQFGEPYLSYDKSPDRIVWAVPLVSKTGGERLAFIINDIAYEPSAEETIGGLS